MMISGKRKGLAAALTLSLLFQQALITGALATNISGVTGNNGIYNINPEKIQGHTGFRQYENFNLSKGDIANLIFKYGKDNVSQFINLVDNTITVDGIVNTVRDSKFYNGHAVFVSPNGMVVGSSGVLNVGSLSVYTPTQSSYNNYIRTNYKSPLTSLQQGDSNVIINGKVISAGDINVYAKDAAIGTTGALISGAKTNTVLTTEKATDILFNSLVNTSNLKTADTLSLENGNIVIRTTAKDGGINIAGRIQNNGNGNITIQNNGSNDLQVSGLIKNTNGNLQITNAKSNTIISGDVSNSNGRLVINNNSGQQNITSTAKISNSGDLRLTNKGAGGQVINGNVSNDGLTLISSNAGNTVINGKIINQNGMLTLVSNGNGLEIGKSAEISNNDKIKMTNTGKDGFTMNGQIKNSASTALTNWAGNYIIGGSIENLDGKMNLSNASSQMHLTETSKIVNNGDLQIINSGKDGLTIDGTVENTSTTNVWNVRNDLNINGTIANSNGILHVTNDGNALNVGESGKISNNAATYVTNSGDGGLNYNGGYLNSGASIIENKAGDLNINNTLNQVGNRIVVKNSGNELNINTTVNADGQTVNGGILAQGADVTVFNTGLGGTNISGNITATGKNQNIVIANKAGNFNTNGAIISNENGNITITNRGIKSIFMDENTIINNNGKVIISNSGKEGARIDAYIKNNGVTNITNNAGDLVTNSRIENQNGKLEVVNNGNSLTIGGNALLTNNSDVRIANTGDGGMLIKGDIENNGSTAISNWAGDFVISGKVENQSGKMNITSAQKSSGLHLTKEGQLLNNDAELLVQNTGANGMTLDGEVKNNASTTLYNTSGDMQINGLVQNKGEFMISNRGGNLSTGENAIIKNDGKTTVRNTSIGGMTLGGTFINQNDTLNIENRAGYLKIAEGAEITNRKADINITNSSGGAMTVSGGIYNLEGDNINISNTSTRGGIIIDETGLVNTQGDVNLTNYGIHGINVKGTLAGNNVNIGNKDSHVYLGNPNAEVSNDAVANVNALSNVVINIENGSLLNNGTKNTLISTGKDLTINVNNGKIGVDTGTSGGGYVYGPDGTQVDTTKSINIDVDGKINAHTLDSKGTNGNYVINMASKGSDMNIDHIYGAGRVILLTDAKYEGNDKVTTGSILNAASDPTKANIEAKGLSLISSGTIGKNEKPLTVNDTNYAYKSDYQAIGDINLKSLDDQYDKADVRYIISNEGNINAEFTGLARVKDTYAGGGTINVTNRTRKMNLVNNGTTPNTGITYYNFRGEADIMPIED